MSPLQTLNYTHETVPTLTIQVGGIQYAYRAWGDPAGFPIILLQHITGTMDDWDPLITNALAKEHQLVIFDNTGVGSTGGRTPETINEMARDAIAFITALGFKKVDLLGYSLGGFVAQQILLDQPSLVRRAILAGTGPEGGDEIEYLQNSFKDAVRISPNEPKLYLFFEKSATSQELGLAFVKRLQLRINNRDLPSSQESISAQFKAMIRWGSKKDPEYPQLKKIGHPLLVVTGSNDIMIPTVNSYILFKRLPNARLSLYPDSEHGSIFQYPELFIQQARYFLNNP